MKASSTQVWHYTGTGVAYAYDKFGEDFGPPVPAHFKGSSKQRRIARRSYIRYARAVCAARSIPLYINGVLQ